MKAVLGRKNWQLLSCIYTVKSTFVNILEKYAYFHSQLKHVSFQQIQYQWYSQAFSLLLGEKKKKKNTKQ